MNQVPIHKLHDLFVLTDDGRLLNRRARGGGAQQGKEAGSKDGQGYRDIRVDGVRLLAHRVVFAMTRGEWPSGQVDHINGVRSDNRPSNLRDVPHDWNCQNLHRPPSTNTSGYLGVHRGKRNWRATIYVEGKQKWIGGFADPAEAYAAYLAAKRLYHPACTI